MSSSQPAALTRAAFATLLLIAVRIGANHVAACMAFDNGVDVATAVAFRSGVTALVVSGLLRWFRVPVRLGRRHRRALLAFTTYPLWTALWARVGYVHRPDARMVHAMPVMLLRLAWRSMYSAPLEAWALRSIEPASVWALPLHSRQRPSSDWRLF